MTKQKLSRSVFVFTLLCSSVYAHPEYKDAWVAMYPTSTLPARMAALTGSACNVCHHPRDSPANSRHMKLPGNCYRDDLIATLKLVEEPTIAEAIFLIDGQDSDGDGLSNGVEATTVRADNPREVGYNMGLVGDTGTDPCSLHPTRASTGVLETPPSEAVPAVSAWGLVVMTLLLLTGGTAAILRRTAPIPIRGAF